MEKNDVIHFRVSQKDKEEINMLLQRLSASLPAMCIKCESRFTIDEFKKYKGICPHCGGEIKLVKVNTSQMQRYAWKFLKTIELYGYNMYDVIYEMLRDAEFRNRLSKLEINIEDLDGNNNALMMLQKIIYLIKDELKDFSFSKLTNILYIRAVKEEEVINVHKRSY